MLSSLLNTLFAVISLPFEILQNYGWYVLFVGIGLAYILQTKFLPWYTIYKRKQEEEEYAAKYHKNPDLIKERLEAQQRFADKLQEKYKKDAEEHKKKLEEKENRKREEFLQQQNGTGGNVLGSKNKFKPEYNPLMGHGPSNSYRAPKRSACSKGGCG